MSSLRPGALLAGVLLLSFAGNGCAVPDTGFRCARSDQCVAGSGGVCEASGLCSYADTSCESGQRYGQSAGASSGMCTDEVSDAGSSDALAGEDAAMEPDGAVAIDAGAGEPDAVFGTDAGPILVNFTPSNIPSSLLTSATNALTLQASDGAVAIDTDTGSITRLSDYADLHPIGVGFTKVNQGTGLPDVGVFSMTGLVIESGVTIRVRGSAALAFAVSGDAKIGGVIDASGGLAGVESPGPGGGAGGSGSDCDGQGSGGGTGGSQGQDVGGGGAGYLMQGGRGGDRGNHSGGNRGSSYGGSGLVPLRGGSGGGCGGGSMPRAAGGGGGGAVQISARGVVTISSSGAISGGGGGGAGGVVDNGGGGGGSGGAVLIEAGRIAILGVIAVNGGGGGAGADDNQPGAPGQAGKSSAAMANGGAGQGEGEDGGAGGADLSGQGVTGSSAAGNANSDNAGGGGGSAGRIRLRSDDITRSGTVSPLVGLSETPL